MSKFDLTPKIRVLHFLQKKICFRLLKLIGAISFLAVDFDIKDNSVRIFAQFVYEGRSRLTSKMDLILKAILGLMIVQGKFIFNFRFQIKYRNILYYFHIFKNNRGLWESSQNDLD